MPRGLLPCVARPRLVNGRRSCVCTSSSGSDRRTVLARVRRLLKSVRYLGAFLANSTGTPDCRFPETSTPGGCCTRASMHGPTFVGAPSWAARTLVFVPVPTFTRIASGTDKQGGESSRGESRPDATDQAAPGPGDNSLWTCAGIIPGEPHIVQSPIGRPSSDPLESTIALAAPRGPVRRAHDFWHGTLAPPLHFVDPGLAIAPARHYKQ